MPFGDIWNEYLERNSVSTDVLSEVRKYEEEVLLKR
jgi:L-rhamnose isomerase